MKKFAWFVSGNGSFSRFLYQHLHMIESGELALVISDRPCKAFDFFDQETDIPAHMIDFLTHENRDSHELEVITKLHEYEIDYVFLAYNRLITETLREPFANRIINVHLSLLPAYIGPHGVRRAYDDNVLVSGATMHLIDDTVDLGPMISQAVISRVPSEDLDSFANKIFCSTCAMLLDVISKICAEGIRWHDNGLPFIPNARYGELPFNPALDLDVDRMNFDV